MSNKALIIVDVQNDFCPGGSLAVPYGDSVIPHINKAIAEARLAGDYIFFTRDWHPPVTSHFKNWPVHCVAGTHGAKFHDVLDTRTGPVVSKGTNPDEDAYSGFDGLVVNRKLGQVLKSSGITTLEIGGLATDYCVKSTVLDAVKLGFETFFVYSWSRGVNIKPRDSEDAIDAMLAAGAHFKL